MSEITDVEEQECVSLIGHSSSSRSKSTPGHHAVPETTSWSAPSAQFPACSLGFFALIGVCAVLVAMARSSSPWPQSGFLDTNDLSQDARTHDTGALPQGTFALENRAEIAEVEPVAHVDARTSMHLSGLDSTTLPQTTALVSRSEVAIAEPVASAATRTSMHLSGRARAMVANACSMTYRSTRFYSPMLLINKTSKVLYALHGKAASSQIRKTLNLLHGNHDEQLHALSRGVYVFPSNVTFFTFVRDPLKRAISGFFEDGWGRSEKGVQYSLERFTDIISKLEQRIWLSPHMMGQFVRLPNLATYPLDFVGTVETIDSDWAELQKLQATRFGALLPNLPRSKERESPPAKYKQVNEDIMPATLKQRICVVFRDDYCCFGLPVPSACNIAC